MKTKNTKLLNEDKNRKYYSKSDGNFLDLGNSLQAHKILSRINWARQFVHNRGVDSLLDVGTKDGYFPLLMKAEGLFGRCKGIDPSEDAIEYAKEKAEQAGLEVEYEVAFFEDYKDENIYEAVSCMEVIEHVVDIDSFINKLISMGIFVIVSTPDAEGRFGMKDSERNEEHVRLFTKNELFELFHARGCRVLDYDNIDDQHIIAVTRS